MEQHYKSFMDKQCPSDALMRDTISKAKALSDENKTDNIENDSKSNKRFIMPEWNRRFVFAAVVVICLIAGGIWKNTQIQYTDLSEVESVESSEKSKNDKEMGDLKNSYLGNEEQSYYIFNKNVENSEIVTGQGKIKLQVAEDLPIGLQVLYQTTPKKIKGYKVYLGKYEVEHKELLVAAFEKSGKQYYLEGEMVTEEEMTDCIMDLLK